MKVFDVSRSKEKMGQDVIGKENEEEMRKGCDLSPRPSQMGRGLVA
jgi:hypothetical protein